MKEKEKILKEIEGLPRPYLLMIFDFVQFLRTYALEEEKKGYKVTLGNGIDYENIRRFERFFGRKRLYRKH